DKGLAGAGNAAAKERVVARALAQELQAAEPVLAAKAPTAAAPQVRPHVGDATPRLVKEGNDIAATNAIQSETSGARAVWSDSGVSTDSRVGRAVEDSEITRSYLGSSEGHQFSAKVIPGGTGTAFVGHGYSTPYDGKLIVPQGTFITLPRDGIRISERTGQYMERGDWNGLANLAKFDKRIANDIEGMATYLPGAEVPNYTLTAPSLPALNIYQNSTSVEFKTPLVRLLQRNMGCVQWAACTEFKSR
ncbi:putative adhesin, partial [Delftia tsuruhatensis]